MILACTEGVRVSKPDPRKDDYDDHYIWTMQSFSNVVVIVNLEAMVIKVGKLFVIFEMVNAFSNELDTKGCRMVNETSFVTATFVGKTPITFAPQANMVSMEASFPSVGNIFNFEAVRKVSVDAVTVLYYVSDVSHDNVFFYFEKSKQKIYLITNANKLEEI